MDNRDRFEIYKDICKFMDIGDYNECISLLSEFHDCVHAGCINAGWVNPWKRGIMRE